MSGSPPPSPTNNSINNVAMLGGPSGIASRRGTVTSMVCSHVVSILCTSVSSIYLLVLFIC